MQLPPDISQELFDALELKGQRLDVLVELYDPDEIPTDDGFDPANAILRVASTERSFLGEDYQQYVLTIGNINRTITEKFNRASVSLDNHDRSMAQFVLTNDLEGMFMVIRLVSREFTPATLSDSLVVFVGKCEPVFDADHDRVDVSARQYIGSIDEEIPWRQYTPEDELGRLSTNVLFEGFLFSAHPSSITFKERVRRGGFLGLLGFKKTVTRTLQYTNKQGVEVDKSVALILGRAQNQLAPVAYIDVGGQINAIYANCEGPIRKWFDLRIVTAGFQFASTVDSNPEIDQFRFGYDGDTNGQVPFLNNLSGGIPGNGYYSRTAMLSTAIYGTEVSQDDPAPDVITVTLGMLIDLPDDDGEFTRLDWSDNPAYQTRWLLTKSRLFNLDPAFINNLQCLITACYCDEPVLDTTNGELIVLPNSESANYGVLYRRYHSTSLFTPQYFKHYFLGIAQDPLPELTLPTVADGLVVFYDPTGGVPIIDTTNLVRRRFSSNIYLAEKMKTADFLWKILLPSYRGFLTHNAKGKVDIKCKRPAHNTIIRSSVLAEDSVIAVNSITPWIDSLAGKVIIGTDLLTSEVREVIDTTYTAVANDITLAVTGNLTPSGSNFSGGSSSTPATATVTVTGLGTLTVTIDGHSVSYTTISADTTATAAAMLTQFLKADTIFKTYIIFTWDKDNPTVISCRSKMGFLTLASPLENAHDIAEEVLRIQMSFSDRLFTPADLAASNILKGSVKWPISSRFSSINRIDGKFIDSPQDFKTQEIRTRQQDHIDRVNRTSPKEITLTAVDNYNQAKRLEQSALAEERDLNFFMQHTSDRRALLLEEGDLICNTHASGGFRNVALRIEEVTIDLNNMTASLLAKRYLTSAYGDDALARNVPLPTTLGSSSTPPDIAFDEENFPPNGLSQTTATEEFTTVRGGAVFGATIFGQFAHVRVNRPSDPIGVFTEITTITPDSENLAEFEFNATEEGIYTVELEVCFSSGTMACNTTKPQATITISFGVLGLILGEDTSGIQTEDQDFIAMEA